MKKLLTLCAVLTLGLVMLAGCDSADGEHPWGDDNNPWGANPPETSAVLVVNQQA